MSGQHIAPYPEDVLNPEIAQRHFRFQDAGRVGRLIGSGCMFIGVSAGTEQHGQEHKGEVL
jgi:hypothetical protein